MEGSVHVCALDATAVKVTPGVVAGRVASHVLFAVAFPLGVEVCRVGQLLTGGLLPTSCVLLTDVLLYILFVEGLRDELLSLSEIFVE